MNRNMIIVAVILAVALLAGVWYWRYVVTASLPVPMLCIDEADARAHADKYIASHGGTRIGILGTGSMAPYIPLAPLNRDPMTSIVAYAVMRHGAAYSDMRQGELCVYEYSLMPGSRYAHVAAQEDGDGWIMTGIANGRSESWTRVTMVNFKGIVDSVFVW